MEVGVRARRSRETSPDRVKLYMQPKIKPFRKVKIVYYLCRNGQLEHPHFIEVSHLPNQQLRLKDVMDRLTILRGRGMPSLFSWSCKRTYKNGYVWNDLTENDVIHPTEGGAEYVLKGSEIIEGCSERFQQLQITQRPQNPEPIFKRKSNITLRGRNFPAEMEDEENDTDEFEEDEEEEEKPNHSCYNTPYSRCSRGVSTDEIETTHNNNNNNNKSSQNTQAEINLDSSSSSPPSSSSTASDKTHITNTDKTNEKSKRFEEEGDPAEPEPGSTSRNSVLLHLIACGSVAASKGKNAILSRPSPNNSGRKSAGSLHRGLLCRIANKAAEGGGVDGVDEEEINYMSENPRFGCPQLEEKEYFSGSIVEAMSNDSHRVSAEPCLKKSSSYNEERSLKSGIGKEVMMEEEEEEEKVEEKNVKGRCIPRKRFSVCKQTNKKQ